VVETAAPSNRHAISPMDDAIQSENPTDRVASSTATTAITTTTQASSIKRRTLT